MLATAIISSYSKNLPRYHLPTVTAKLKPEAKTFGGRMLGRMASTAEPARPGFYPRFPPHCTVNRKMVI